MPRLPELSGDDAVRSVGTWPSITLIARLMSEWRRCDDPS